MKSVASIVKRSAIALAFCLFAAALGVAPARAQLGYQQITTALSAATGLTVPNGSASALICAEAVGVRWRDDGTNPTASVGEPLSPGQCLPYSRALNSILFIQQAAGAILNVTYYGNEQAAGLPSGQADSAANPHPVGVSALTLGAAVTMQSAAVANGNGTVLPVTGYGSAIVDAVCSVACSGGTTINFEATDSTGTFFAVQGTPLGGGSGVTSATSGGQWIFNVAGLTSLRARISAYSAGTITVTGVASTASAGGGGSGGGGSSNITQFGGNNVATGTGAGGNGIPRVTVSNDSQEKIWDGTTQAAVDAATSALKTGPQYSGDIIINPSANFTRPANTTAYASGQLVANNTTAGSVVAMSWTAARVAAGNFRISRVRMSLSSKSITNTNFRIHFFNASPGVANGDGGTFTPSVLANEVCEMDVTIALAGSDVSLGYGAANQGVACDVALGSGSTLYGLIEARAAYTPGNGETVTVIPEIHQN